MNIKQFQEILEKRRLGGKSWSNTAFIGYEASRDDASDARCRDVHSQVQALKTPGWSSSLKYMNERGVACGVITIMADSQEILTHVLDAIADKPLVAYADQLTPQRNGRPLQRSTVRPASLGFRRSSAPGIVGAKTNAVRSLPQVDGIASEVANKPRMAWPVDLVSKLIRNPEIDGDQTGQGGLTALGSSARAEKEDFIVNGKKRGQDSIEIANDVTKCFGVCFSAREIDQIIDLIRMDEGHWLNSVVMKPLIVDEMKLEQGKLCGWPIGKGRNTMTCDDDVAERASFCHRHIALSRGTSVI